MTPPAEFPIAFAKELPSDPGRSCSSDRHVGSLEEEQVGQLVAVAHGSPVVRSMSSVRGRSRSMSTTESTWPGLWVMTRILSERNTASGIEWVTRRVVVLRGEPDTLQLDVQALSCHLVECSERLIEQQQVWVQQERSCDSDPLPHASRELGRSATFETLETDQLDKSGTSNHQG